jgi:predicted LPLAT superfamily acyltransferase
MFDSRHEAARALRDDRTPSSASGGSRMSAPRAHNPGPSWGIRFMYACDSLVPEFLFRPARMLGTWVALAMMPLQRGHSRAYLRAVTGREPSRRDIFRHFFAFEELLMLRLRVARGLDHRGALAADADGFRELLVSGEPALLGTFHVGHSDLTGFLLGLQERRRVFMVRQRVGNSHDTEVLGARFREWVTFIWVNEPENLLFALKEAVAAGGSVALKCDRLEFSAKTEAFEFLGAKRLFPFTIYHLALIFQRPVVLCVGLPAGPGRSTVHSSPLFRPDTAGKAANLARARVHFQDFLVRLEGFLRHDPLLWFNFTPLNPPVP